MTEHKNADLLTEARDALNALFEADLYHDFQPEYKEARVFARAVLAKLDAAIKERDVV